MDKDNIQLFILTRFNIRLWHKDKVGCAVLTEKWLEHRFQLFEKYCLPSVAGQTCKGFEWIVLFDVNTPKPYKDRIDTYRSVCPQFVPVYLDSEQGMRYRRVFKKEVAERLDSDRVVSIYLDNDDAIDLRFVEDLRHRVESVEDGTFIYYDYGYQFYSDFKYMMRIRFPRNHFVSLVEKSVADSIKTVYGYGGHYFLDKVKGAVINHVVDRPMWCEVVHEKNMHNDAYFLLGTSMVGDPDTLKRDFGIGESVRSGVLVYLFRFLPRFTRTSFRRIKYKLFGREW
ncbi:MAG: putative rhamnosyl transferase [Bacteroidales bacterium]|nr:putative rhamnosyl transferase [Bacteroidales bacterium]